MVGTPSDDDYSLQYYGNEDRYQDYHLINGWYASGCAYGLQFFSTEIGTLWLYRGCSIHCAYELQSYKAEAAESGSRTQQSKLVLIDSFYKYE